MVRFARLIHRPVRVLGGPAVRAACGGSLSLPWLLPKMVSHRWRCRREHVEGEEVRVVVAHRFTRLRADNNARPSKTGPASRSGIRKTSPAQLTCSVSALLPVAMKMVLCAA